MNISAPFIARPVATGLLAVALMLAGLLGYHALPVAALPSVDFPSIQVTTQLPGASPQTMATLITASLERQLGEISGLSTMTSVSSEGLSQITLQFNLGRQMDSAAQDVQAAITASGGTLPTNLPYPPTYSKVNPADAPILTLALTSDTLPTDIVSDTADTVLQPKLSQIAGVGRVSVAGNMRRALRVQLDPARLAANGLSMEDVRTAVSNANVNGAKGGFDGTRLAYEIGANDQLLTPDAYGALIIATRNGAALRVRDLGTVRDGMENTRVGAWYNGHPAVVMDIQRQPGANIVQTVAQVRAQLADLQRALPAGITVAIAADRTATIRASVADVQLTLLLAIGLVVLVIALFLGSWRATLIPAVALPLSLLGTFGVMAQLGYSLDNLSLMALTIATGFVVDDAIVMIENITRYIEAGVPPMQAAFRGASQIGFTIVSLTVSLIAVFIPLLFMTGVVGRLFSEFAVTLSIAVIVSAIISLTITPMMCARLLHPARDTHAGWFESGFARLQRVYSTTLDWTLRRQPAVLAVAVATLVGTVWLYIAIPKGFLPAQDTGTVIALTEAGAEISVPQLATMQNKLAALIRQDPAVTGVVSFVGAGLINPTPNTGRLTIALAPHNRRDAMPRVVMRLQALSAQIVGLRVFLQPVQDIQIGTRVSRTQFQYTLADTNAAELAEWAPRLLARLQQLPDLQNATSDAQTNGAGILIDVDRNAAMRLGVSMQAIQDVLYDSFGQRQISTIFAQNNQYRVVLEAAPAWQADVKALQILRIPGGNTATGSNSTIGAGGVNATGGVTNAVSATGTGSSATPQIPLSAIARIHRGIVPLAITHQEQFPSVTLSFDLADGVSLGTAVDAVAQAEHAIGLPSGIVGSYSGDAAEFQSSVASEPWLIGAAVVVIYIVLGVLYESTIHPVTILSTLPSAGIGALLALMLCGQDLSLVAVVGIVLLMGIVKKNAIMMIDFAIEAERDRALSPHDAIREACLLRFRPIMMTTAAALLGALPLALGHGTGSELRFPLGVTIIGGLLLSQLLTLYTTPAVYLAFERLRSRPVSVLA